MIFEKRSEVFSKVNIFTDINVAAVKAEFSRFTDMNKGIIDLIPAAVEAIKQESMKKMELFGSVGKGGAMPKADTDAIVRRVVEEVLRTMGK